jgi:hypothetical protein
MKIFYARSLVKKKSGRSRRKLQSILVVPKQNIVLDAIALRPHEVPCLTDRRHEVVSSHDFRFCGASSVELLLSGAHDGKYTSQR